MIAAKQIFCLNEQGKRRNNEDRIYPQKGNATTSDKMFIVCDGVGGENKGEVASEIVCTSVYQYVRNQDLPLPDGQKTIEKAIQYANRKLAEHAVKDASAKRMSTTLTLILMNRQSVTAAWCGDTRIHHIRDGRVIWKSDDHSVVHELVKNGEISQEEAKTHPSKNIITRSLNALNINNKVDFHEITDCRNDDFFLLCTDGFLEQIDEEAIYEVLTDEGERDKEKSFLRLCEGRTKDNFSMYLVKVSNADTPRTNGPSGYQWLLASLIIIACLACIIFMFLWLRKNETADQKELNRQESIRKTP